MGLWANTSVVSILFSTWTYITCSLLYFFYSLGLLQKWASQHLHFLSNQLVHLLNALYKYVPLLLFCSYQLIKLMPLSSCIQIIPFSISFSGTLYKVLNPLPYPNFLITSSRSNHPKKQSRHQLEHLLSHLCTSFWDHT